MTGKRPLSEAIIYFQSVFDGFYTALWDYNAKMESLRMENRFYCWTLADNTAKG